ncbi:CD2 associated protein [Trichuris trichiura]|uniref:CD2 associated protein n=1 Tax=Trichuris trichiura TaxID=36087 RepID=A0A077ZHN1_TRITR|nr:CD2 associated protein [Trichuris trichiura]
MHRETADFVCAEPKQGNVANLVKRISSELKSKCASAGDPGCRRSFTDFRNRRLKVVAAHIPTSDDELRLEVNDILEFVSEEEDGRMRGRLNGKLGTFPVSCVKFMDLASGKIAEQPDGSTVDQRGDAAGAAVIQPKKIHGVGFGNIFAANDGKFGLKSSGQLGALVSETKKPIGVKDDAIAKPLTVSKKSDSLPGEGTTTKGELLPPSLSLRNGFVLHTDQRKEYVRANYAYAAENDDELTLKVGDIITVLSKECEDPGWWLGELNGAQGVFPDNFVSPISPEEATGKVQPPVVPLKPAKPCPSVPTDPGKGVKPASVAGYHINKLSQAEELQKNAKVAEPPPPQPPQDADVAKTVDSEIISKAEAQPESNAEDAEKLCHLTVARPKMKKRPPSHAFLKGMTVSAHAGQPAAPLDSPTSTEPSADQVAPTSDGCPMSDEVEALRRAFNEFKCKMFAELRELEKRFAAVEAKRPTAAS